MNPKETLTLGALRKTGYTPLSVKDELRNNLIKKLTAKENVFEGILGFDDTVIPDIERAILSRHNILLLGLRGQAKTRIARLLTGLLDEYIPIVKGSEINDDPLSPISRYAIDLIAENGDKTPIDWIHRSERYVEKLATPDVSIADLIGDVDPIKAATLKLPYSDERVIHFGLIPRAHRSIFVINELPDLQARIQVSLFNILQEGDMQIRGFKLRLPLDIQFVFTANPEDYTSRGSIITPLKDRIESQILTHYPESIEVAKEITALEAKLTPQQSGQIIVSDLCKNLLERISFEARESEYIDHKSGVSARLSISGFENLVSAAERRMLINNEKSTTIRISDFWGVIPAITGKVELVYEGEQEGALNVAIALLSKAIQKEFLKYFPNPEKMRKGHEEDSYAKIRNWFSGANVIELLNDAADKDFHKTLKSVTGLEQLVKNVGVPDKDKFVFMELVLHALAAFDILNRDILAKSFSFRDLLANMWNDLDSLN